MADCLFRRSNGAHVIADCSNRTQQEDAGRIFIRELADGEEVDLATGRTISGGTSETKEPTQRASSERGFVGLTEQGQPIWEVSDPDDPLPTGFYVGTVNGLRPATEQQLQRVFAEEPARGGGGSQIVPYSFTNVPGVGFVRQNRLTGQVEVAIPTAPEAPKLSLEVDNRTGELITIDPQGNVRRTGQLVAQPTLSPEQIRAQELEDFQLRQQAEREGRQFQAEQAGFSRGFTAQQNALDRAARAGEFAQNIQLQRQQEARQTAAQLADLIAFTDPSAVTALSQEGGGVFANAIAGGGDALSNRALLPAARTLQSLEGLTGFQRGPSPGTNAQVVTELSPETIALSEQLRQERLANANTVNLGFLAGGGTQSPALGNQGLVNQGIAAVDPTTGMVGIQGGGGFDPSLVRPPVISAQQGFAGRVTEPTVIIAGENGPEDVLINPEDNPFLERIRQVRQRTQAPDLLPGGFFNVGFQRLAPSVQGNFFRSLQTRFGVPAGDLMAEAARFAVPATSRSGFNFGF